MWSFCLSNTSPVCVLVVWWLGLVRSFGILWTVAHQGPCPWDFPGKNSGLGCRFLLEWVFLTQGSKPCLLLDRWILYHWATWEACMFSTTPFILIQVSSLAQTSSDFHLTLHRQNPLCTRVIPLAEVFSKEDHSLLAACLFSFGRLLYPLVLMLFSSLFAWVHV